MSTCGWILRANSSNTRCWYCISVPKRAAWNRRSPSQIESIDLRRSVQRAMSVQRRSESHAATRSGTPTSFDAIATSLMCSTSRLCSEWNTWWTAVRPMFSLPRPSPVMKCASSSSLSYATLRPGQSVASTSLPSSSVQRRRIGSVQQAAVGSKVTGVGVVRDVVQERMAGADAHRPKRRPAPTRIVLDVRPRRGVTTCAKPFGTGNEVAVRVGRQQRHVEHVGIGRARCRAWSAPAP